MTATGQRISIAQALAQAAALGLARIDAQILLLHALGQPARNRAWLISHDEQLLDEPAQTRFASLLTARAQGAPVAYLTGSKEFWGLPLKITPAVLDPRSDTETLVEWALECASGLIRPRILDLGTGSGAVALALKHARPDASVHAVERSSQALALAQENARRLNLDVTMLHGSWFEPVRQLALPPFDLIVSNPPYLCEGDPHLDALMHEPTQALVSGSDGLHDIRSIAEQAPAHLNPDGWLLLEHGWQQHRQVREVLHTHGYRAIDLRRDLAGHCRCTGGKRAPC